jgi:hypothetical protein
MKKNQIPIIFLLSFTVVFLFIPRGECRSESILIGRSLQESQFGSLLDTDADAHAILKSGINFEEEILKDISLFSFGRFSSFCSLLKFSSISQELEVQLQAVYTEQSPRPPPFYLFPSTLMMGFQKDCLAG